MIVGLALWFAACSGDPEPDASPDDAGATDGEVADTGAPPTDAGADPGPMPPDEGDVPDEGWADAELDLGEPDVGPRVGGELCMPCQNDADCNGGGDGPVRCLPFGNDGSFCGSACDEVECPEGYECKVALDAGGTTSKQCVPMDGAICPCKPEWADLGLLTDCTRANAAGICEGTRACGAEGLTECSAALPTVEICDGADNDCNGEVDDVAADACDDNKACTADACGPDGCTHELEVDHCLIGGKCWGAGESSSPCVLCNPDASVDAWIPQNGAACDDGSACTTGDVCQAGACTGKPVDCDDGLGCTSDVCDEAGECVHTLSPEACLIDGTCWLPGELDMTSGCAMCVPGVSGSQWTPMNGGVCETASPCMSGQCVEGTCLETPADCSALADACNDAACDAATGVCKATPKPGSCDDGDPCTTGDACAGGGCAGTSYVCVSTECTTGVCDGIGGCESVPANEGGVCAAGDECAMSVCVAGACVAGPKKDCSAMESQCVAAECNAMSGACEVSSKEGPCDDGDACTTGDLCAEGACVGTPDPGCAVEEGVPTAKEELLTWLQAGKYSGWAAESAPHPSAGPHGTVKTFMNPILAASMAAGSATHPVGAAAVKELYSGATVNGWAVEVKTAADSDGGAGWYWYERIGSFDVVSSNGPNFCSGCHAGGGVDFVLTPYPLE